MRNASVLIGMIVLAGLSLIIPLADDRQSPKELCKARGGKWIPVYPTCTAPDTMPPAQPTDLKLQVIK